MTTTAPTTKIIIVAGERFQVPAGTDNEAIRQQLAITFPDVANATITRGTATIDGVDYETVEFVKQAGRKGLLDHLQRVPALPIPPPHGLRTRPHHWLLQTLLAGALRFEDAMPHLDALIDGLQGWSQATTLLRISTRMPTTEGAALCQDLDTLPAVAADVLPHGW